MRIAFIEIQNFRKLKSIHVDIADKTTLFVGANNSGKTSAMDALGYFLAKSNSFEINDFTLSNWVIINKIGSEWEERFRENSDVLPSMAEWEDILPAMDVWLKVGEDEVHHVSHMFPALSWRGGSLGVRLRFEPDFKELHKEYLKARKAVIETIEQAASEDARNIKLWPESLLDFLDRQLNSFFAINYYKLDPTKTSPPENGKAILQPLFVDLPAFESDPFKGLIKIDHINAQRGFHDQNANSLGDQNQEKVSNKKLSEQLRSYYDTHLDPSEAPKSSDLDALKAMQDAQSSFNKNLQANFNPVLSEVTKFGYPGKTDPKLTISSKINPMDSLRHNSAVQYEIVSHDLDTAEIRLLLPEDYNGLGYQNLISIVFRLMSHRDKWMQVGKAAKKIDAASSENVFFPPLHIVLVEEPEAHLHAQVQQVFMRKAYDILRNHEDLGDNTELSTQLLISTHSSYIAHEGSYSSLRYFHRLPASDKTDKIPTSTVANLSEVFGKKNKTSRFVTRYLKATHCDLFFADAVILIEGSAERMLLPQFIQHDFKKLGQSYVSILEVSGSHAHTLLPLIEHLQLTTLIITDLDSAEINEMEKLIKVPPKRGTGLVSRNTTLRKHIPKVKQLDRLLDLPPNKKIKTYSPFCSVRVAYQTPIEIKLNGEDKGTEAISYTFEDSLIYENLEFFRNAKGFGLIKKINKAISESKDIDSLASALHEALKDGDKAKFILDLLYGENSENLTAPTYIAEGLTWLEKQLTKNSSEIFQRSVDETVGK